MDTFLTSESTSPMSFLSGASQPALEEGWGFLNSDEAGYGIAEKKAAIKPAGRLTVSQHDRRLQQRLHYFRQLAQVLRHSSVALPGTGKSGSEQLLNAVLEFGPHQMGMSLVVDEDAEATLVLTAYWPTGRLHVSYFLHFPADEPVNTVVNFYNTPLDATQTPVRQWGWHSSLADFKALLDKQLRNGQWELKPGW